MREKKLALKIKIKTLFCLNIFFNIEFTKIFVNHSQLFNLPYRLENENLIFLINLILEETRFEEFCYSEGPEPQMNSILQK